jgi:hypothetical protein
MLKDIMVFLFFCFAMFFVFYFTIGEVHADLKTKLSRYKNVAFKLVSAGSVEKKFSEACISINAAFFKHDGERINADKYTFMVVDGNSMDSYGIKDGAVVVIEDDKSLSYGEDTIFVLKINNRDDENNIENKLRRAIDFYYCTCESKETFDAWIKNHPGIDAEKLYEKYKTEYAKIEECKRLGCRLLISETTKEGSPYYSFHPESYIYGKVKYQIPKETVKIIEKR